MKVAEQWKMQLPLECGDEADWAVDGASTNRDEGTWTVNNASTIRDEGS